MIASSANQGRGYFSNDTFQVGQVVLRETATCAVLINCELEKRCSTCFLESQPLARCSKTKKTHYLDRTQQKLDWKDGYKEESEYILEQGLPSVVRLVCRLLWKLDRETLNDLCGPERLQQDLIDNRLIALKCQQILKIHDIEWLSDIVNKVSCNAHTICDWEGHGVGIGLFATKARFVNHSDTPNTTQVFEFTPNSKPTLRLIALGPIRVGEQVTMSYTDIGCSELQRRIYLSRAYDIGSPLKILNEEADVVVVQQPHGYAEYQGKVFIGMQEHNKDTAKAKHMEMELLRNEMNAKIAQDDLESAYKVSLELTPLIRRSYPQVSLYRALHFYTLSTLEWVLGIHNDENKEIAKYLLDTLLVKYIGDQKLVHYEYLSRE